MIVTGIMIIAAATIAVTTGTIAITITADTATTVGTVTTVMTVTPVWSGVRPAISVAACADADAIVA